MTMGNGRLKASLFKTNKMTLAALRLLTVPGTSSVHLAMSILSDLLRIKISDFFTQTL